MWNIQLFGGLAVSSSQRQLTRFRTQKAASLLGYLAFHASPASQPRPRESLIGMLWPDAEPDASRHNLSNALSFLRHVLEPPGVPAGTVILADRSSVRLNPAAVTVDVVEFEAELSKADAGNISEEERTALLLRAAARYEGPLLPGDYEEWIAPQAVRLENLFVQAVVRLAPLLLQSGNRELALSLAQRAVTADPLSEEATGCLMQALSASGQPSPALRAYRSFAQRLQAEMDAQPSPELQRLAALLGQSGPVQKADLTVGDLSADAAVVVSTSPAKAGDSPGSATVPDAASSAPRGRLLGAEFLLRTTTRFFDRVEEKDRLGKMLSTPRTRLVTMTGPGGTGKTRLSLEVAAHLVERSEDNPPEYAPTGAVFVSLASTTGDERLYDVTLRSLGIIPSSSQEPLDQLVSALEAHPNTLLVLDNFEQLVEEGALRVLDLLGKSAGVKLLVTSRQRLNIEGEREFHLAPLPTCGGVQTLEEMQQAPSVALFVDRAQTALPDFQLTERNITAVSQLCDYLEGLPLAIELAAARVSVLSPARILDQVQANRLDFLSTRRRDAESRQKTIRATLDWSYHLLLEPAQAFLAALSAFRGGWTLEAAEAVCGGMEVWKYGSNDLHTATPPHYHTDVLDLLTLLRDSSLIQVADTDEGLRFTQLETICEYGAERLSEMGADTEIYRRHRAYYLGLAEQAEPQLFGAQQGMWLDCLQAEHDNLCIAIDRCEADDTCIQENLRFVGALSRFWEVRGYLSLGRGYLGRALGRAEASAPTPERAKALQEAGRLAQDQGDIASARALLEESLNIQEGLGDKSGIAKSLDILGTVARYQGDNGTARTSLERSLDIRREIGDKRGIAGSLNNLGVLAFHQSDYGAARTVWEESLAIRRELGDKGSIPGSLNNLGNVACEQGDYAAAQALYEEALVINREIGNRGWQAINLNNLGAMALRQGDLASARTLHEQSLAIRRELGARDGIADSLNSLGDVTKGQGDYVAARALYEEALLINRETGNRAWGAANINNLGIVAWCLGDYPAARAYHEESLAIHRELGDKQGIAYSLNGLANVARDQGDCGSARALLEECLTIQREIGYRHGIASSLEAFAALIAAETAAVTAPAETQEASRNTVDGMRRAARLRGAAETLREEIGSHLSPEEGDRWDSHGAPAREALGETAFAAAWGEGRGMTMEEAIKEALDSSHSESQSDT